MNQHEAMQHQLLEPLPGKYFVSHSYKDVDLRDELIRALPSGFEPYLFPPISVSPLEFASNTLIGAMLACDGVIYLDGGHSLSSFWVAFEREYGLRAGKQVYAYTPSRKEIERHRGHPTQLRVFFSAAIADYARVDHIREFMASRRFFDWVLPHDALERDLLQDDIRVSFRKTLKEMSDHGRALVTVEDGLSHIWDYSKVKSLMSEFIFTTESRGYLVVFWSEHSPHSEFQQDDLLIARELERLSLSKGRMWSKRWNEEKFPGYNEIDARYADIFDAEADRILFVTLDSTPLPQWARHSVQLYGDQVRSEINRIDDLVVRLYWLIYAGQKDANRRLDGDE